MTTFSIVLVPLPATAPPPPTTVVMVIGPAAAVADVEVLEREVEEAIEDVDGAAEELSTELEGAALEIGTDEDTLALEEMEAGIADTAAEEEDAAAEEEGAAEKLPLLTEEVPLVPLLRTCRGHRLASVRATAVKMPKRDSLICAEYDSERVDSRYSRGRSADVKDRRLSLRPVALR